MSEPMNHSVGVAWHPEDRLPRAWADFIAEVAGDSKEAKCQVCGAVTWLAWREGFCLVHCAKAERSDWHADGSSYHPLAFPQQPTREGTRLITYRGPGDELNAQLGKSLPDGMREVRRGAVKLTVRTLDDTASLLMGTPDPSAGLLVRLGAVERELSAARLAQRDAENELQALRDQMASARQEAADARANLAQWQSQH